MTSLAPIPVDLLTPLGAYLRLRGEGGGSFLLESVERGRLGRNSFMGRGARIVSLEEAEDAELPVVGYVSYDYAATLEPTVPLPDAGTGLPESSFVVADTLVRFDHGAGVAEVLAGDPEAIGRALSEPLADVDVPRGDKGELSRSPSQERYEEMVRICQAHIRAGDAYQVVPSQRAERPTSASPSSGVVVPAIGQTLARPCSHATSRSGDEPTSATPPSSSRKRYGDGLTRRSAR